MMDLAALAATGLAFFIVAVSPGPANISIAAISMTHGRGVGLRYGMGLASGLVVWGLVAASGMGVVLQGSVYLLMALKLIGGAYLLWLAWQSARSAMTAQETQIAAPRQARWFLRGLILNLSNPKSVIAWMAALSVGLGTNDGWVAVTAATVVCIAIGFLNYTLYATLFSLGRVMQVYRRARRRIDGVVAGLFAMAGFGLIRSAFAR